MSKAKILLVDHSVTKLTALKSILESVGAKLLTAQSSDEALLKARKEDDIVQIILNDQMPDMESIKTVKLLQEETLTRGIPIIFITTNSEQDLLNHCFQLGTVDLIMMPFKKQYLLSKVRVFLELWELRTELVLEVEKRRRVEQHLARLVKQDPLIDLQDLGSSCDELDQRKTSLRENIKTALQNNELSVFYQPIVNVSRGRIVSCEALLRWHNRDLDPINPDEFIPAAERAGLMSDIGSWVLTQALNDAVYWRDQLHQHLSITINASRQEFKGGQLFETIKKQLALHRWDENLLQIEINESLLFNNEGKIRDHLYEIKKLGIGLSVDDFGTGYSSLKYLIKSPLDTIKIDCSLISSIHQNAESKSLVKTIIAMAHGLGLKVIAEGVETREQQEYLQHKNCDYAQGFFFGKPMAAEQFAEYLVKQKINKS